MTNVYRIHPLQWILDRDTGTSSVTIWAVMIGIELPSYRSSTIPLDAGDFGRCYRLLKHVPEWLPRLPEVADKYPSWKPIIREWETLTFLHETAQCDELTGLLKKFRTEEVK